MIVRLVVLALAVNTAACAAGVGDACSVNSDCGSGRICDTSQPNGYCTVSNCVRNGCPGNAVCIEYADQVSYCMQRCGPFAFCRDGFSCIEGVAKPKTFDNPDGIGTYPGFCNQVASSPDAVTPPDDGLGTADVPVTELQIIELPGVDVQIDG